MRRSNPSRKLFLSEHDSLGKVGPKQSEIVPMTITRQCHVHREHRRKASNVVMPECPLDFWQVGFVQECAVARRLQIHSANLDIQSIFLWGYQQVRANRPQLSIDLVANVGR